MVRCIHEVSRSGRVNLDSIYTKMSFDLQTDKEFSANGVVTNPYMRCPRLDRPAVGKDKVFDIILNGGEEKLLPERRLDQTLYFTMKTRRGGRMPVGK